MKHPSPIEKLHEACAHTLPDGEPCIVLDYGDLRAIRARLEYLERVERRALTYVYRRQTSAAGQADAYSALKLTILDLDVRGPKEGL